MLKISGQEFVDQYVGQKVALTKEDHLGINAGQLEMEFKLSPDESVLLMRRRYNGISPLLKEKFETEWSKASWMIDKSFIFFKLRLPDLPVVLKPDIVQKVLPGQSVISYCQIPLSIEFDINEAKIGEFPMVVLSKTWFGEPDEGVLCYSLKGQVKSNAEKLPVSAIQSVCTIEIVNRSNEVLTFDRMCLRTEYMGLYKSNNDNKVETSKCRLVYLSKDKMSKINYVNPSIAEFESISDPRMKQTHNLIFKSFKTI